jgi:hypothetical protein
MRKITLTVCAAAFLLLSCNNNDEKANSKQDPPSTTPELKKDPSATTMPDTAAMNKAWNDFKTPGDMHKWMEKTNGTWEADISQWMDPAAPPTKAKGTLVQSSVLGGRYVTGKYSSMMFGQPMQGMSTMGYDNAKKIFISTWIDNFGTGIVYMTGTYDEKTKTLNLKGYQTDPMTGKDSNIREEMTMIDNDSYTMSIFGDGMDGKEMKFMEGTYKRKK